MLSPGVLIAVVPTAAATEGAAAPNLPPWALSTIMGWMARENGPSTPQNASALLDALRAAGPLLAPGAEAGWDAYFAAFGLAPTPEEERHLRAFQATNPHLSREIELLAGEVARAQRLRDQAFSRLTDAQWDLLPDAVGLVAAGQSDALTPDQVAALLAVDVRPLLDAASILSHAADAAPARIDRARALDAALDAAIPPALRDPASHQDPAALLRAAAGPVAPVTTDLTLEQAVRALSMLTRTAPADGVGNLRLLPADVQAPLAAILVAHSRELAGTSPDAGLATLATISAELPALTRAAYNLSLASAGATALAANQPRPLGALSHRGLTQPLLVLEDLFGAAARPPDATLVEGLTQLHAARAVPLSPQDLERARQAEAALGPGFSAALGAVLAAQADYEHASTPASNSDLVRLREAVAPILDSDGPLTLDQIRALQESSAQEQRHRQLLGSAAFALVQAILALTNAEAPKMTTSTSAADDFYAVPPVLIMDDKSSRVDADRFPGEWALVVDLGGDDTYVMPVAGVTSASQYATSVAVDLRGHDRYLPVGDVSLGGAIGDSSTIPLAFLLDLEGNDVYRGGKGSLGHGVDGIGMLVDLRGDDRYDGTAGTGLAFARTSSPFSAAAGVHLDVLGNDEYDAVSGYARLGVGSASTATTALFFDVAGADAYRAACPREIDVACFGTPRPDDASVAATGAVVFIDAHGNSTYPRRVDPMSTGENTTRYGDNVTGFAEDQSFDDDASGTGDGDVSEDPTRAPATPAVSAERYAFVSDARSLVGDVDREADHLMTRLDERLGGGDDDISGTYRSALQSTVHEARKAILYNLVNDEDGDVLPSSVESNVREGSEDDPTSPLAGTEDTDGDGFYDLVEALAGTSREDASEYPVGVPHLPEPLPPLPQESASNFILNLPPMVAIGGHGTTRYAKDYRLVIDLGNERDHYTGVVGANGHVLDLGGNDVYAPAFRGGSIPPSLAAVHTRLMPSTTLDPNEGPVETFRRNVDPVQTASLIDLGGNDRYVAGGSSLGAVSGASSSSGLAFFLDSGGDDVYRAPQGLSQGYVGLPAGKAYFLDLGGNDRHESASQGVITRYGSALFVDSDGSDVYDTGAEPVHRDAWDDNQAHIAAASAVGPEDGNLALPGPAGVGAAVFLDLGGRDQHLQNTGGAGRQDHAARKEERLRATPLDGNSASEITVFLDSGASDSDADSSPDVVEAIAGSDSGSRSSRPVDVDQNAGVHYLTLPRLGILVGKDRSNAYATGLDLALLVDVGGGDTYHTRAGASSPRFPTSLLVDVGMGGDTYDFNATTPLRGFATFRLADMGEPDLAPSGHDISQSRLQYVGAQGAGVLGVGVLRDQGGANSFRVVATSTAACQLCDTVTLGASQGTGVLGVGVLSVGPGAGNRFHVETTATSQEGRAHTYTQSQGAGVLGVGILSSEGSRAADTYALEASTRSVYPHAGHNATSGQGYGLQGAGYLLDMGGSNVLTARSLAQGAAQSTLLANYGEGTGASPRSFGIQPPPIQLGPGNGGPLVAPPYETIQGFRPEASVGQLMLTGVGHDTLVATARAQGYADGVASFGLLLDAEGNDRREMRPYALELPTVLGQGAGIRGGTALLVDNRGNDRNHAPASNGVQGYGALGQGLLVDLSGADEYEAADLAQGAVSNHFAGLFFNASNTRASHPAFGLLMDRMGNDVYSILGLASAQGSSRFVAPPSGGDAAVGVGVFIELGGMDVYTGVPAGQTPGRTQTGNDWRWQQSATSGNVRYSGLGIDGDNTAAVQNLLVNKGALLSVSPSQAIHEGLVVLRLTLSAGDGKSPGVGLRLSDGSPVNASAIDRVEFFERSTEYLGPGWENRTPAQQAGSATVGASTFDFNLSTDELDEHGLPAHPDGKDILYTAYLYPRVGTVDVDDRRAAVDAEPLRSERLLTIDNRPVSRAPLFASTNISTATDVNLRIRVDRDLERCDDADGCPLGVDARLTEPGPNEWDLPPMSRTVPVAALDASCTGACLPVVVAKEAGDRGYVTWTPPVLPTGLPPEGFFVYRQTGTQEPVLLGWVDARLQPKKMGNGDAEVYWFRDNTPGANKYWVHTLYRNTGGSLVFSKTSATMSASDLPDVVTGLRAVGVEGKVKLVWRGVPGITEYVVTRYHGGTVDRTFPVAGTNHNDADGIIKDSIYRYSVVAKSSAGNSPIPSMAAEARPSPGHLVEVGIYRDTEWNMSVKSTEPPLAYALPPTQLGGGWTHNLTWKRPDLPDGHYTMVTRIHDGNPARDPAILPRNVTLDSQAPRTTVTLPYFAGGPHLLGSSIRIPFSIDETGSGVRRTAFYVRVGDEPWPNTPIVVNGTTRAVTFNGIRDGIRLQVVAVSEDNVGNMEGVNPNLGWTPTFADGFAAALARGAYTTHVLDISPPMAKASRPDLHARPGDLVDFGIQVIDRGTGIGSVLADLRGEKIPMFLAADSRYEGQWKATGADDRVQIIVIATDNAGNEATFLAGTVTVDSTVPSIGSALLTFPGGRVVGRPGETATVQVAADDALTGAATLNVSLETANVSSMSLVHLRYNPDTRVYSASFPVNAMKVKEANVTLRVKDLAQNVASQTLVVRLNNTNTTVTPPALTVGPDRVLVNWTTTDPVRSRVDHGTGPQLGTSTPLGPTGTTHSVLVTGLKPDTEHYLIASGVTDSGIETRSDIVTFRTTPALNVTILPGAGLPYSQGDTRVGFEIRRFDGVTPAAEIEAVLLAPRGAPRVVATLPSAGPSGAIALDLSGVRDGDYALLLRARDQDLGGQSAAQTFVVDRVAPLVFLPEARAAGKGATYSIRVEERGSGIDLNALTWTFGNRRCSAQLAGDLLSCTVPDLGFDTEVTMRLDVPDRAGNVASVQALLAVDSAPPVVSNHVLGAADGHPHLRPGARGRLSVDVQDHSVKLVTADLTRFGGEKATELRRVSATRYEATFDVPSTLPEGQVTVLVSAVDGAGQATTLHVTTRIDGTPPALLRGSILPQAPGEILVALQLEEPARVRIRAAGPAGELQAASGDALLTQLVTLKGLRAGAPLRVAVTMVDQAGHETTVVLEGGALVDDRAPSKVPSLRLEDRGDGRVLLRWDAATDDGGVAHYRVVRTLAGRAPATLPPVSGLMLTDELPVGVAATYTVAAVDHGGNAGEVATVTGSSASVPILSNGTVDPPLGGPGIFTYTVDLVDASGAAPSVVVRVNGVGHPMTADKADCRQGCRYAATVLVGPESLATGPHQYSFHVVSGAFRVAYPEIDTLVGPTVLQGEEPPLVGVLAAANQVPAGGLLVGALAVAGAVAALVWIRRRKA